MERDMRTTTDRFQVELSKMKELHDTEKVELEIKQQQENKRLRDDVEALKGALVKRDHF